MRGRRTLRLTTAATALVLFLAGCSTGAKTKAATSGSTEAPSGSITFWIQSADPFVAAHKAVIAEFEKDNPGSKVNLVQLPFADFQTRLTASLPQGTGPDAFEGYVPWMTGAIRAGQLDPVPSSYLTTADIEKRYYSSTLPSLKYKDTYFGLPANLAAGSTRVLLINSDVVRKAAVTVPADGASFEAWVAFWKSLTKQANGKTTLEGLGQSCGQPADQFLSYLLEYGGSLLSEDQRSAAFNSPAGVSALTTLTQLTTKYHVDDAAITDNNCIPQGVAATGYRGTWVLAAYKATFPNFTGEYRLMPLPTGAKNDLWQGGSGWGTFVPAKSVNKDLAWKFLQYLDQHRAEWIKQTGEIPAIKELAAQVSKTDPALYGAYYPILDKSRNEYTAGNYFTIYGDLSDMYTSVVLGKTDVKGALIKAESQINTHLKQWWSQYPS